MPKKTTVKKTTRKVVDTPWASVKAIQKDHSDGTSTLGVEIVCRMEVHSPGHWLDVDELLEKANELGHAEITKVLKL